MKVLVWGINYAPEVTGIAPCNVALCEHLRRAGHDVRMLTTFAYYPEWKKSPPDRGRLYRTDVVNHVPVHRCWHYVPARVSSLKRILHEGTFVATSFLRALFLGKFDVAVVVSPPLLLGAAAALLTWLRATPYLFHVQDLQPDAALGLGMLKPGLFTRLLYRLEALAYRHAARVSGISAGMLRAFARKGVDPGKTVYFPNGAALPAPGSLPAAGAWRQRQGIAADDFLAVYAGNMGVKQGLDIVPAAAALTREPRVRIALCGHGAARERLAASIARRASPNLRLLPLQDDAAYAEMMVDADLCLITQQSGTGQFFFPSKLLSALAHGKPVLAVADADSELALAVGQGGFGFRVDPGDAAGLAAALDRAAHSPGELACCQGAAREFVQAFDADRVLAAFTEVLIRTAGRQQGPASTLTATAR